MCDKVTGCVCEGDEPLPRVFSLLSFMLMASEAPSGICGEREARGGEGRERREGEKKREDRGHRVKGELESTRTASLSMPSWGVGCRVVYVCVAHVCVCARLWSGSKSAGDWLGSLKSTCSEMD